MLPRELHSDRQQFGESMNELLICWLWCWGDWRNPNSSGWNLPSFHAQLMYFHCWVSNFFRILPLAKGGTLLWLRGGSNGSVSALYSPRMWEITSSASLILSKHARVMLARQQEKASRLTFTADGVIRDCSTEATGQRNGWIFRIAQNGCELLSAARLFQRGGADTVLHPQLFANHIFPYSLVSTRPKYNQRIGKNCRERVEMMKMGFFFICIYAKIIQNQ